MSATAAAPEVLDVYVGSVSAALDGARRAGARLARAVEALAVDDAALRHSVDHVPAALRRFLAASEALIDHVARSAEAFRLADGLLARLGDGVFGQVFEIERSTEVDVGDVDIEIALEAGIGVTGSTDADTKLSLEGLSAEAAAEIRAGLWAVLAATTAYGPLRVALERSVFAGAFAEAAARARIGLDGIGLGVGGEVFAGARVDGEVAADVGPVHGRAEAAATAGIGATADADVDLGLHDIGFRLRLGWAFGVGYQAGGEVHVDPLAVVEGAVEVGAVTVEAGKEAGKDAIGEVGEVVGGVLGATGSAAESVVGWFS
jgi:hypothetical protein